MSELDRRPLTLAAVVNDFPAPSQTFIRRKLLALSERGVDVTVMASSFGQESTTAGYRLVDATPWRHPRAVLDPQGRRRLAGLASRLTAPLPTPRDWKQRLLHAPLESLDTDIVHFEFSGIAVAYLDALDAIGRRSRLVVSCRGAAEQIEPIRDPRRADQLAEVFAKVDLIHCVSDDIAATAVGLGAPPAKLLINRPAVPVAAYSPLRRPSEQEGPLRVLSVGRLHWKKGLDDGIRAVAAARDHGVDLMYRIAGGGDQFEKLSFLIDQLDLVGRVDLLGSCSEDAVRAELDRCDVLLLPSLSEGISNAVLEAMAAGRAVVTTDSGGMSEVVQNEVNGFVVEVGDTSAMADRLELLARDPELRHRLAAAAAATSDDVLDISRQANVFLEAYRSLVP